MQGDTKELDALTAALNKSAERVQTLWFSFLAVTLYMAIAVGTTTHRMLLLEEGQTLPVLNVKLPLLAFYFIAPAFYIVLHAYILMMLVLLARTAKAFDDGLAALDGATFKDRERYRMRVENGIFLQIIIGASPERSGFNGKALRLIAIVTLVIVPVLLLVLFQVAFLSYHSELVTWWHRLLILLDLGMVWTLWPSYLREWGERIRPRLMPLSTFAIKAVLSLLVATFSMLVAVFPSEFMDDNFVASLLDPTIKDPSASYGIIYNHGYGGVFRNTLWLPNEPLVDADKLAKLAPDDPHADNAPRAYSLDLSHRNLVGAVLTASDLRRVKLDSANLTGAVLDGAFMQGASFKDTIARGAQLSFTNLQGAHLESADFQGASFHSARFYGASIKATQFQGADLANAAFIGATIQSTKFDASWLENAKFQSAALSTTAFNGAFMGGAQFQGVPISTLRFDGASLSRAAVWRVDGAKFDGRAYLKDLDHDANFDNTTIWDTFDTWSDEILNLMPNPQYRELMKARLKRIAPHDRGPTRQATRDFWNEQLTRQLQARDFQRVRAKYFYGVLCSSGEAARYVVRSLASHVVGSGGARSVEGRIAEGALESEDLALIVETLKAVRAKPEDGKMCPGAKTLLDVDYKMLKQR